MRLYKRKRVADLPSKGCPAPALQIQIYQECSFSHYVDTRAQQVPGTWQATKNLLRMSDCYDRSRCFLFHSSITASRRDNISRIIVLAAFYEILVVMFYPPHRLGAAYQRSICGNLGERARMFPPQLVKTRKHVPLPAGSYGAWRCRTAQWLKTQKPK